MCGIVAAITERNVVPILLEGLKRLEYRGYDSAGIAVFNQGIQRSRQVGKVAALAAEIQKNPISGRIGIAHTRWATHGKPTIANAHPHTAKEQIAIVHNGIIDNYAELKQMLEQTGHTFYSQTDTEVIAKLLQQAWERTGEMRRAIQDVTQQLTGAYALVIMHAQQPDILYAVRVGSPLVIGLGIEENFLSSDSVSLLPVTHRFIYLEEGDIARVTRQDIEIIDAKGQPVDRELNEHHDIEDAANKGRFKHFMQKEMFEQPDVLQNLINAALANQTQLTRLFDGHNTGVLKQVDRIRVLACGTSFHAGLVAKFWLEQHLQLPCDVEIASQFRYRQPVIEDKTLVVTISQSGETADTLAALRLAKEKGCLASLAICNVANSSLVRESDLICLTQAGIEMGVASTKAFTTQILALLLFTQALAQAKQITCSLLDDLKQLPSLCRDILQLDESIAQLAKSFQHKHSALFLGRDIYFPIALEGSLKLKEISYIHAEAYPAGELKHGPLALVDDNMPIIALAPNDGLFAKMKANLEEVKARDGDILLVTENAVAKQLLPLATNMIVMPNIPETLRPLCYTLPLQLLSYHVALQKGTDVDQPRNLAKSVTVE